MQQSYEAALKKNETLSIQARQVSKAEEKYSQVKGNLFPSVSGSINYLLQDQPSGSLGRNISPSEQSTIKITGTQPLFQGLREFAAIRQQKLTISSQKHDLQGVELDLYSNVVESFYQVMIVEANLENLKKQIQLNEKRVHELQERKRIGRSRASEVLTVQSSLATLTSEVSSVVGQLKSAKEAFAFYTGLDDQTVLTDTFDGPTQLKPLSYFLDAVNSRPDLKASIERVEGADESIWIAKGAHLPSVNFSGNYYFKRPGTLSDVHWDVQFTGTLPIFSGGVVQSQVREAVLEKERIELELSRLKRMAVQNVKSLYANVSANQEQIVALKNATNLSMQNYNEQEKEYRLGLVTNLDVLQALTQMKETRRAYDQAVFTVKKEYLKLLASIGKREGYIE